MFPQPQGLGKGGWNLHPDTTGAMFNRLLNTWIRKALMCKIGTLNLIFLAFG